MADMADPTKTNTDPVQLDVTREGDRQVVLTPEDEDRFVRSCQWVVETSKLGISREVWLRELHQLMAYVANWAEGHASRVKSCFAARRDDQLAIYVIPVANHFDFDLTEELTNLDFELAEKYQLVPCDVIQIPKGSASDLNEAVSGRQGIMIYGDDGRTQEQVVA